MERLKEECGVVAVYQMRNGGDERNVAPVVVRALLDMQNRGQLSAGLVPAASPGLELFFSARSQTRWGFALSGAYAAPQNSSVGIGSVDVGLTRAAVRVPFEAARSPRLRHRLHVEHPHLRIRRGLDEDRARVPPHRPAPVPRLARLDARHPDPETPHLPA